MTELQKELGYDGFLKELDNLEILLLNFINNLPLEADAYLWRHTTKLLKKIIGLKASPYLNSSNSVKRRKFDRFLYSINHFQNRIVYYERLDYGSINPDRSRRATEILDEVRTWEKLASQINYNYIFKL